MPNENIVLNWIFFLGKCLLIILAAALCYAALRWLRALIKRLRAIRKLKKAAQANGYTIRQQGLRCMALGKRQAETAFVLSRGDRVFNIHFIPTVGKNRTLRFFSCDSYVSEKELGFVLLNTHKPHSIATAHMFKPQNISGSFLQWAHTDNVAFPSGTIRLRGLSDAAANRTQGIQDVVILNPAPLKAFARSGNAWSPIIGGESAFGLVYHDIASFCSTLK